MMKVFNPFRWKKNAKALKQIRFVDNRGNTLFLVPDGGSIIVTKSSGEQVIRTCCYVNRDVAEIDGTEYRLRAYAEKCQRAGAVIAPEAAPEYYVDYCIIRRMPVADSTLALAHDPSAFCPYVTLERLPSCDTYGNPRYFTEGWRAIQDYGQRVSEKQSSGDVIVAHRLKSRGGPNET